MRRRGLVAGLMTLGGLARDVQGAIPPVERDRIDALIRFVGSQAGTTFVRNGTAHSAAQAATFLRRKLDAMGGDVRTARGFVERIATGSSFSGKPYQVRFADGHVVPAAQWLGDELTRLEAAAPD